jgi:L-rhamnonate dehydratase
MSGCVEPLGRIVRVEWGILEGTRPRACGKNARLDAHGSVVRVPMCRVTTSDGCQGTGVSRLDHEVAASAIGLPVSEMFSVERGTADRWMAFDFALFDLVARSVGLAVYELLGTGAVATSTPLSVRCYDTCLYFDDLLTGVVEVDHRRAAAVVAEEAALDYAQGHRAFKVKIGRGARWMNPGAGLERDVAVVGAVREAIGEDCSLMVDANNGYTLNAAQEFLEKTAEFAIEWLEEPFHEDAVLLEALHGWLATAGMSVLIADGETASVEDSYALAADGLLDVVQCDILRASFTRWLRLGAALDEIDVFSAPHHFGLYCGNYVTAHLGGAIRNMKYIEWDEATVPGLRAESYSLQEGRVIVTDCVGFGLELDDAIFGEAVESTGFDLRLRGSA